MRKLVLLVIVIALLLGGDLAARRAVEVELERRIRDQVAAEQGVQPVRTRVHISSFPAACPSCWAPAPSASRSGG